MIRRALIVAGYAASVPPISVGAMLAGAGVMIHVATLLTAVRWRKQGKISPMRCWDSYEEELGG